MKPKSRVALFPSLLIATFPIYFLIGATNGAYRIYAISVLVSSLYSSIKASGKFKIIPINTTAVGLFLVWIFFSEPIHYFEY